MHASASRGTFRARLRRHVALLCFVVLALTGAALYVGTREVLLYNVDRALLSIARTEVASALDRADGRVHVHDPRRTPSSLRQSSGYEESVRIEDASGRLVVQTANLNAAPPLRIDPQRRALACSGHASYGDLSRGGETYRGIYYPLKDAAGNSLAAIVAVSRAPMERSLQALLAVLVMALAAGGGAAAVGANLLARHVTRPLEQIARVSRSISEENLAVRIAPDFQDRELLDVAAGFNGMLSRLERAFTAERRFVSDASHELRSPLANLRVGVEVALLSSRTAEDYRELLQWELSEIDRLTRLVSQLLTLSRADLGQLALQKEPSDLAQLAHEASRAYRERAASNGLQVIVRATGPTLVPGDRDRLREVIDNLLENALRYSPAGSAIDIAVGSGNGRAFLEVRDAGPGIPVEEQAHIFNRFYRSDLSRARNSGGTGLGLAICRAIVVGHHGEITVRSQPGEGTVFAVTLPIGPVTADRPALEREYA